VTDLLTDIAALGSAPISDASPAGESARYEPEFEQIEAEISKLESVNGTPVDWRVVAESGTAILRGKSKDLLVASFLCRGLFEVHGYAGLSAGLKAMLGLTETFWDNLFPEAKRVRARGAAAAWLAERLAGPIRSREPGGSEREAVAACVETLQALSAKLDEKLAEHAPDFGDLRRSLQERLDALPAPQAPTKPAATAAPAPQLSEQGAAAAPPTPTPAAAPAAAPGEITNDQDVQKGYRAARDLLRSIALYLAAKNPGNATAYILTRQAAWLGIEQVPPDNDGVTALREVQAGRMAALEALVKEGKHADLVREVEATIIRAPFWLDGHRMTAAALEALGHSEARKAVIEQLAGFLRRFPRLIDLKFANQSGFADDLTRAWIQEEVLAQAAAQAGQGAPEAAPARHGEDAGAPWLEAAAEAKKLATKGKVSAAIGVLQAGQRQATSARERFLWALEQARLCQAAGRADLAVPQLEHMDTQATRFQLEEWEPRLSLEVAGLLLSCYKNQSTKEKPSPERLARIEQLQARIVRLDILSAVDSGQK
jgi:type VI secretion system protein VasJ